jgi:predicted esterase
MKGIIMWRFILVVSCAALAIGCLPPQAARNSKAMMPGFAAEGPEWETPIPRAKAPVNAEDYRPVVRDAAFDPASEAFQHFKAGDRFKSAGDYAQAEKEYEEALRLNPALTHAAYQLACNYALWDKPVEAEKLFRRAFDQGFSDYPFCRHDSELGAVRELADFSTMLKTVRERYLAKASAQTAAPVIFAPAGSQPAGGWPVMVLLHGYGDSHESYFDHAELWAGQGFLAIALPGSVPFESGGFIWNEESVETTHEQIQAVLAAPLVQSRSDAERVFLCGFSQGGIHAFQAAALHPADYAGVVPVGPGGQPWTLTNSDFARGTGKRLWLVWGQQDGARKFAEQLAPACTDAGWVVQTTVHPGGHQFPEDWVATCPRVAAFLLQADPN